MKENKKTTGMRGPQARKEKQNIWISLAIVLIFIAGIGIFFYPIISNLVYERAAGSAINNFDAAVTQIKDAEINERLGLANAYNGFLAGGSDTEGLEDVYTTKEMSAGVEDYARMLEVKEQIGHIIIPKIGLDGPIYAGTSEEVLQKGIGHLEGTSLPVGGNYTHALLTGHRGLPTAKLFTDLDKLAIGDKFYIKYIGGTLAYQVDQIKIVEPTDFSDLAIEPGHDYCTLLTCTPYMINSHRLLVRGHRIEYVEAVEESEIRDGTTNNTYRNLFYGTLPVLIVLLIYTFSISRKAGRWPK
ncbi:MAG: class C sortase [Acetobacterium sp.]